MTRGLMPVISMFYGIIIRMFYFDTDKHQAPHIHLQYAEESAVIGLPEGISSKDLSSPPR